MGKGNSFAMGASVANGPTGLRSWRSGRQAPPPVTIWDHLHGRNPE